MVNDMNREREQQPHRIQEQGSLRVTLYPLDPQAHELTERSFTRYFPDLATYERVRQQFKWDYTAIEVWTRQGEQWQPDTEHTVYGKVIKSPNNLQYHLGYFTVALAGSGAFPYEM